MSKNKFTPSRGAPHKVSSFLIFRTLISLGLGLVVGFCVAKLFIMSTPLRLDWMLYSGNHRHHQFNDTSPTSNIFRTVVPNKDAFPHRHIAENSSVAEKLYKEVRILCWIMTRPKNHKLKALHVKRTWGQRCNKLIFISTADDEELNSIALNVTDGLDFQWSKTKAALKYIYANHLNDADWFFKADDHTYTIMENLRFLLYPYSSKTPIYFGCKFKVFVKQGFLSRGAAYVLSKEALRRLVTLAIPQPNLCDQNDSGFEILELRKCLKNVHVFAGDSRDQKGLHTFIGIHPKYYGLPPREKKFLYWNYSNYKVGQEFDCCSDFAIAFHYIAPKQMYAMDYMIYHLQPYGIVNAQD